MIGVNPSAFLRNYHDLLIPVSNGSVFPTDTVVPPLQHNISIKINHFRI